MYPPKLTDGPRTGASRVEEDLRLQGMSAVSRADVAEFMLGQLEDPSFSRKNAILGP